MVTLIEHTLYYDIPSYIDDTYEYDIDHKDMEKWFDSLDYDVRLRIARIVWSNYFTSEDRDEWIRDYAISEDFNDWSDEDMHDIVTGGDGLIELVETGQYDEELKQFFKSSAMSEYEDQKS